MQRYGETKQESRLLFLLQQTEYLNAQKMNRINFDLLTTAHRPSGLLKLGYKSSLLFDKLKLN